jgi:3-oxoacyl-[acyl-carrier protein] reductase
MSEKVAAEKLGLDGKRAIITGASRGIGEAVARTLVEVGVRVVGVGRTFPSNWEGQFKNPEMVSRLIGDVSDPQTAEKALKCCLDKFGGIDILVNNAGMVISADILNLDMNDWDTTMNTNVKGIIHFCRAVAPVMVRQKKGGRMVNVSSVAADFCESGLLAYSTTKGAIDSFTHSLAIDLSPYNITVNAVAPGWVNTLMGAGSLSKEKLQPVLERIPLGRVASTDEIADVVLFLCSDLSRYVTGQVVIADGGQTIQGTIKGIQY